MDHNELICVASSNARSLLPILPVINKRVSPFVEPRNPFDRIFHPAQEKSENGSLSDHDHHPAAPFACFALVQPKLRLIAWIVH